MKCQLCKNEFVEDGFCYTCSVLTKDNKVFELEEENNRLKESLKLSKCLTLSSLKSWLEEKIDNETENQKEAQQSAGMDCPGSCMAIGAIDCCKELLDQMK